MEKFFTELWMILTESSIWLIFGFLLAGLVHVLIPKQWMLKHLGGNGFLPILKASLLGIPLPLCSCSVIPVAAGLRKQGATKGASAAFAISTPQTGEESVPLTWALFGPIFALARPIIAVTTALIAGTLIDLTHKNSSTPTTTLESDPNALNLPITNPNDANTLTKKSTPEPTSCCATTPTDQPKLTFKSGTKEVFRYGFKVMLVDIVLWLTIGLLMAALIGTLVPENWIQEHVGTGILPMLAMLLVGIPLYICATSSTPLAFGLVAAGLSPGAALVLLLSGPATNVATMSWLLKDLGAKALAIYLATIAAVALSAGIIFDQFFTHLVQLSESTPHAHDHHTHTSMSIGYKEVAAFIFIAMLAWALGIKASQWLDKKGIATKSSASPCCSSTNTTSSCCSTQPTPKSSCCSSKPQPQPSCCSSTKKPAENSGCCSS